MESVFSHGLSSRPLESCHHQCLKAVCGVLVYPKGGTLKLRYSTNIFTTRFPPWSLPRVGNGDGKRQYGASEIMLIMMLIWGRSGLLRRHVQVYFFMSIRIQGIQRRGDGKDCASLPPKEWGVRSACLLGEFFAPGDAWNLLSEGTGMGVFRLDSPAEGISALALVHFN